MDEQIEQKTDRQQTRAQKLKLPILSVAMDGACLACIGLVALSAYLGWDYLSLFMIFIFGLGALITPLLGIIFGILSLCMHKTVGKVGIALGIIAIVLPVLTVLVTILLFTNGVVVIRFM